MINEAISTSTNTGMVERFEQAQDTLKRDHKHGLALLNALFREGSLPRQALNGRTMGKMVAVNIAPILTPIIQRFLERRMPWVGKLFDATNQKGDNIFWRSSLPAFRLCCPFYRGYLDDSKETMRAFSFRTYIGKGIQDPDRQVLKIDYNDKSNPALSMRRILDELVQVDDNFYLGKAHVRWWWGKWQLVFYFTLQLAEAT